MDDTNPFAALLLDVPRFDAFEGDFKQSEQGSWVTLASVLAALAAAVPADLAEAGKVLEGSLLDGEEYDEGKINDAREVAADTITALLARLAAQEAQIKGLETDNEALKSSRDMLGGYWNKAIARAEAAETALAAMTKERDDLANANYRQASCIHVAAANLGPNCSATVDGLPKAARHVAAERDALLLAAQGLVEVLDQNETKGPLPDTALMFCWLAAQNVRAVLRGIMLEKPE